MIDTHCHISSEYYDDISMLMDKIRASGVIKVINSGCDMKSNLEILNLISKYDGMYGAIGFHPTELSDNIDSDIEWLESHINDKKIVAIGEIGLDYHYDGYDKERQIYAFRKQLELASKYNKPVIIHSRDSIEDTYNILTEYKVNGVIHSFSSSLEMAKKFIKLGFYIGVGGVVTFKNAKNIINVIEGIDTKYILLETDSPYLSPEPYRGKTNDSANIPIIAKKIADVKNVSLSLVENITTNSACGLFDLSSNL